MEIIKKILIVILAVVLGFLVYNQFFSSGKAKETSSFQAESVGGGNADEIFTQALGYLTGLDGYPQNDNMGAKLLKEAAEQGHANAQYNLAVCYSHGIGVNVDHAQTLYWLEKAAGNGHSEARALLEEFKNQGGFGTPPDLEEVIEAAEGGDAEAQCKLSIFYYFGQGVPQDNSKMIFWMEKSADQGFAEAQFRLGTAYDNGVGVPKDKKKAAELFAKSAEQGYAYGQYSLGLCYEKGEGVPKDEAQAIKWYTLAGEQGVEEAQYNLAAIYYRQGSDKEIYWLAKAADQKEIDPATGYRLALHYLEGKGVPKDVEKAVDLLKKSANKRNSDAAYKLARLYLTGEEVPEDYYETLFWCVEAEREGHREASALLEELSKDPRYQEARDLLDQVEAEMRKGK